MIISKDKADEEVTITMTRWEHEAIWSLLWYAPHLFLDHNFKEANDGRTFSIETPTGRMNGYEWSSYLNDLGTRVRDMVKPSST